MENRFYDKSKNKFKSIIEALIINKYYYIILLICSIILGYLNNNIFLGILTSIFIHLWSYISHTWAHNVYPLNIFHLLHHTPGKSHLWYNKIIETLVNFFGSGGFILIFWNILIKKMIGIQILDNYVLLLTSFLYTSIHIYNYHKLDVPTHTNHHKCDNTNMEPLNYGPDVFDVLFDTKPDGQVYENINHGILNALIITIAIILIYKSKYDIINILENTG